MVSHTGQEEDVGQGQVIAQTLRGLGAARDLFSVYLGPRLGQWGDMMGPGRFQGDRCDGSWRWMGSSRHLGRRWADP